MIRSNAIRISPSASPRVDQCSPLRAAVLAAVVDGRLDQRLHTLDAGDRVVAAESGAGARVRIDHRVRHVEHRQERFGGLDGRACTSRVHGGSRIAQRARRSSGAVRSGQSCRAPFVGRLVVAGVVVRLPELARPPAALLGLPGRRARRARAGRGPGRRRTRGGRAPPARRSSSCSPDAPARARRSPGRPGRTVPPATSAGAARADQPRPHGQPRRRPRPS